MVAEDLWILAVSVTSAKVVDIQIGHSGRRSSRGAAPDVNHSGQMPHERVEAGGDGRALARAAAEEGDALRVRAQARVHVSECALQVVLLRARCARKSAGRPAAGTRALGKPGDARATHRQKYNQK